MKFKQGDKVYIHTKGGYELREIERVEATYYKLKPIRYSDNFSTDWNTFGVNEKEKLLTSLYDDRDYTDHQIKKLESEIQNERP